MNQCFNKIQEYASQLRSCRSLELGRSIHARLHGTGHGHNMFLGMLLIEMYGRCGSLEEAKSTFDNCVPERNVFAWNALLTTFLGRGKPIEVLSFFRDMCMNRVEPDGLTYVRALGACSRLRDVEAGKTIHSMAVSSGFTLKAGLGTALLDMYGKCGCIQLASKVFQEMGTVHGRTQVTWNAMITAFAQNGHDESAVRVYREMNCEGVPADVFTLASLLGACNFAQGVEIHLRTVSMGLDADVVIGTALVRMYGTFGRISEAIAAFEKVIHKDIVCWTAFLAVLVQYSLFRRAIDVYKVMIKDGGVAPDQFTYSTILGACCSVEDLPLGRQIHEEIVRNGYHRDVVVGTSLVSMYGRCKSLQEARLTFEKLPRRNLVTWNAMFLAHSECGDDRGLVELFNSKMDMFPDCLVLSRVLNACANLGDRETGEKIRHLVDNNVDLSKELTLQNGLLTLYSRCGSLKKAKEIFDRVEDKDTVTWNAMIAASSQYNDAEMSVILAREMQLDGMEPNEITFTSVLHACAHAGFLQEGVEFFQMIRREHRTLEHFHCVIDLLGRVGRVLEAEELISTMPFEPDVVTLTTLVGASRVHGNFQCAARSSDIISRMKPHASGPYVLFSNVCNELLPDEEKHW